jgi:ABC-type Fe3+-hydroxamate transport system substrate-binding protein
LVGVTHFCKLPNQNTQAVRLGGPKKIKTEELKRLGPDVVLAVKEENSRDQVETFAQWFKVVVFDIISVKDALSMIYTLALLLDNVKTGDHFISLFHEEIQSLPVKKREKSVYLVWKDPWMAAGLETFISSMMEIAGFENMIPGRYPTIDIELIEKAENILLSTEPFPFTEEHVRFFKTLFAQKNVFLVDGEMFSWYGTKMIEAVKYFKSKF